MLRAIFPSQPNAAVLCASSECGFVQTRHWWIMICPIGTWPQLGKMHPISGLIWWVGGCPILGSWNFTHMIHMATIHHGYQLQDPAEKKSMHQPWRYLYKGAQAPELLTLPWQQARTGWHRYNCSTMGIKTYKLHQDTRFWTQKDICFASSLFAVCSSISMCRRVHNLLRRLWGVPLSDERDMSTTGFLLGRFPSCAAVHGDFNLNNALFLVFWVCQEWGWFNHLPSSICFCRYGMILYGNIYILETNLQGKPWFFHIAVHLVSGYSCWRPHCEITILVEFLDSICSNSNKLGN